jgi:hypothetical protein
LNKAPCAALSIDLADDPEYVALMATKAGRDAFAVFIAILIQARRTHVRGRAQRQNESQNLTFDDCQTFILNRGSVPKPAFTRAIETFRAVASEHGTEPWMSVEPDGRITVRSYFKYHGGEGWGGARQGAGRPPKNQDDFTQGNSSWNQVESPPAGAGARSSSTSSSTSSATISPPNPPAVAGGGRRGSRPSRSGEKPERLTAWQRGHERRVEEAKVLKARLKAELNEPTEPPVNGAAHAG